MFALLTITLLITRSISGMVLEFDEQLGIYGDYFEVTTSPTFSPISSSSSYSPSSSSNTKDPVVPLEAGDTTFTITLVKYGDSDESYDEYMQYAKERWEAIIVGDVADVPASEVATISGGIFRSAFEGEEDYVENIDDIVIGYKFAAIDGEGGTLGSTTITAFRNSIYGSFPVAGAITFDIDDIEELLLEGTFGPVVLHEMGHALGFSSSMWKSYESGCGASCSIYAAGAVGGVCKASEKFNEEGLLGALMLHNNGQYADGSYCSHWDETQLGDELMTPYIATSGASPLTAITIAAYEDMGYKVSYDEAQEIGLITALEDNWKDANRATQTLFRRRRNS